MSIVELTDASFEEAFNSLPVLVDFYAVWCGPCKKLEPIIEQLAEDLSGKVKVCRIDINDNPDITAYMGISALPTVVLFVDGDAVDQHVGFANYQQLMDMVEKHLPSIRRT